MPVTSKLLDCHGTRIISISDFLKNQPFICSNPPDFVDDLPIEIPQEIFTIVVEGEEKQQRLEARQNLMLVSRAWARLIRAHPRLWAFIDTSMSDRGLHYALQYAQEHPLHVSYSVQYLQGPIPARRLTAIAELSGRWMTADLRFLNQEEAALVLESPAPFVESLTISAMSFSKRGATVDLFGGDAPRLTRLTVTAIKIRLDSNVFSRLTYLKMEGGAIHASISEIIRMIQLSPALRILHLLHLDVSPPPPLPLSHEAFPMSNLKRIHLTLTETVIVAILSILDLPRCIDFTFGLAEEPPATVATALAALTSAAVSRSPPTSRLLCSLSLQRTRLEVLPEGFSILVEPPWAGAARLANHEFLLFPNLLKVLQSLPVTLSFDSQLTFELSPGALDKLTTVDMLIVSGDLPSDLLRRLSEREYRRAGSWMWPRLHAIELQKGARFDLDEVVAMLTSRNEYADANHSALARITSVTLKGKNAGYPEAVAKLTGILGEGKVEWTV